MNSKKAKQLREYARDISVGEANVAYSQSSEPTYSRFLHPVTQEPTTVKTSKGVPRELKSACTRSIYKGLKALHKNNPGML